MSIIVQTRYCETCGAAFKVPSTTDSTECWPCRSVTLARLEAEHTAAHAAAMVAYNAEHADEDPFLNRWGTDLSVGMKHTGKR